jgi:hypothetical protein
MIYKNTLIEKIKHSGMYSAFIEGQGFLKADSLTGIKKLISATK